MEPTSKQLEPKDILLEYHIHEVDEQRAILRLMEALLEVVAVTGSNVGRTVMACHIINRLLADRMPLVDEGQPAAEPSYKYTAVPMPKGIM